MKPDKYIQEINELEISDAVEQAHIRLIDFMHKTPLGVFTLSVFQFYIKDRYIYALFKLDSMSTGTVYSVCQFDDDQDFESIADQAVMGFETASDEPFIEWWIDYLKVFPADDYAENIADLSGAKGLENS